MQRTFLKTWTSIASVMLWTTILTVMDCSTWLKLILVCTIQRLILVLTRETLTPMVTAFVTVQYLLWQVTVRLDQMPSRLILQLILIQTETDCQTNCLEIQPAFLHLNLTWMTITMLGVTSMKLHVEPIRSMTQVLLPTPMAMESVTHLMIYWTYRLPWPIQVKHSNSMLMKKWRHLCQTSLDLAKLLHGKSVANYLKVWPLDGVLPEMQCLTEASVEHQPLQWIWRTLRFGLTILPTVNRLMSLWPWAKKSLRKSKKKTMTTMDSVGCGVSHV